MAIILMDIRRELRIAERLHFQPFGQRVAAVDNFTRWMKRHFTWMHERTTEWEEGWLTKIENSWRSEPDYGQFVLGLCAEYRRDLSGQKIKTVGFFDPV